MNKSFKATGKRKFSPSSRRIVFRRTIVFFQTGFRTELTFASLQKDRTSARNHSTSTATAKPIFPSSARRTAPGICCEVRRDLPASLSARLTINLFPQLLPSPGKDVNLPIKIIVPSAVIWRSETMFKEQLILPSGSIPAAASRRFKLTFKSSSERYSASSIFYEHFIKYLTLFYEQCFNLVSIDNLFAEDDVSQKRYFMREENINRGGTNHFVLEIYEIWGES